MKKQVYTTSITASKPPAKVFKHINDVSKWWPEEVEGTATRLNDEFVFRSGDSHYSKNKVTEFVRDKKVVWLVTESLRQPGNFDWSGTKMIFDITPENENTLLQFTYDGFIPGGEDDRLVQVCDMVIKELLFKFITEGKTN